MAIKLQNLTDEPHQRHTVLIDDREVVVEIRYLSVVQAWFITADLNGRIVSGFRLSLGVLHFQSQNLPFDFVVEDTSGTGLDPFRINDFSTGRCSLIMLGEADMEGVRDAPVPA